jgi:hypothetical protein
VGSGRVVSAWILGAVAASSLQPGQARAQSSAWDSHAPSSAAAPTVEELLATPPEEPPPAPFGSRGQWVVSGSSSLGLSWQKFSNSDAVFASAFLDPTLDWFVTRNVSLGLRTGVSYEDDKGYGADGSLVQTRRASVHVGPRVGVNLPLGRKLSVWSTGSVGFEWVRQTESTVSGASSSVASSPLGYPTSTELGPWIDLDTALLWHVEPHLFVGIIAGVFHGFGHVQGGPEVGGQETEVSSGFLLGGWFGGPPPLYDASALHPPAARPRRFGEDGQVVLSNELVLDGRWTGYAGSSSSSSGGALTAGLDYFAWSHVSVGAAFTVSSSTTTGIDASSNEPVTSRSSGASLSFRFGVDIPMGNAVSLWPRASLTFGGETLTEQQEASQNENDEKITTVGLYAPILVHPAAHFFVGFGPSVAHDLSRSISAGGPSSVSVPNPSNSAGAGLVVGGWL